MAFITAFFSSFLSIFIISHLFYAISGRNKKVALGIYIVFFVINLFNFLSIFQASPGITIVLIHFLQTLGPFILALFVFQRFTGAFQISFSTNRLRQKIPKRAYDVFVTLKKDRQNALFMTIGSLFIVASFFIVEDVIRFVLLGVGILGLILSIYLFVKVSKISAEKIILIVGKSMDHIYQTSVDASKTTFKIKDYFKNSDYIIDGIGTIYLKTENLKTEKHHMFWLATGDDVPMQDEAFDKINDLIYFDILSRFRKYEFRQLSLHVEQDQTLKIDKDTRIR